MAALPIEVTIDWFSFSRLFSPNALNLQPHSLTPQIVLSYDRLNERYIRRDAKTKLSLEKAKQLVSNLPEKAREIILYPIALGIISLQTIFYLTDDTRVESQVVFVEDFLQFVDGHFMGEQFKASVNENEKDENDDVEFSLVDILSLVFGSPLDREGAEISSQNSIDYHELSEDNIEITVTTSPEQDADQQSDSESPKSDVKITGNGVIFQHQQALVIEAETDLTVVIKKNQAVQTEPDERKRSTRLSKSNIAVIVLSIFIIILILSIGLYFLLR